MAESYRNDPTLSMILAVEDGLPSIRWTVDSLLRQTIRNRLELVVVTPTPPSRAAKFEGLHSTTFVEAPADSGGLAAGIEAARAPLVAIGEDHAFPEPDWAEAIVRAHDGPWAVVAPAIVNANPGTVMSWANILVGYGRWIDPAVAGPIDFCPSSNATYKRHLLLELGDELGPLLQRGGALHARLRKRGHGMYLEPRARVRHVNPSRVGPSIRLRFNAGRLHAAARAKQETWSTPRRVTYVVASPLLLVLDGGRIARDVFGRGLRVSPRVAVALIVGASLDAAGKVAGYGFGAGDAAVKISRFEPHRERHLTRRDRAAVFGETPGL